jgi:hypothetical protein
MIYIKDQRVRQFIEQRRQARAEQGPGPDDATGRG